MAASSDDLAGTLESGDTMRVPPGGPQPITPEQLPLVPREAYVIVDEVARGGLGRILRARDSRTGRMVAIKEPRSSDADAAVRFVREAIVTANLQHPGIVSVYEVGRWPDGQPFYAMTLVRGRPLDAVIDDCATSDARLALLPHVIAVADALAYAHGEHIIHRDLKPQNVLAGVHGETVVIDWGLARRVDERDASVPQARAAGAGETVAGVVLGTPAYMAPEQARGERVDERADVYAIGALLYHLLAGTAPYRGRTPAELVERVRLAAPTPLREIAPDVAPDLAAIVARAMARDPSARYASARELAIDLRRFANGQLVAAYHYTRWQRMRRFARKQRVPLAVSALALALLATLGAYSLQKVLASREQARAEQRAASEARDEARGQLRAAYLDRARGELAAGRGDRALPLLAAAVQLGELDAGTRFMAARAIEQLPEVHSRVGAFIGAVHVPASSDVVLASDGGVERWSPRDDRVVWRSPGEVFGIAVAGDAIAATRASGVELLAASDGHTLAKLDGPTSSYRGEPIIAEDHGWIVAISEDGHANVWQLATRQLVASVPAPGAYHFTWISPDGKHLFVESKNAAGEEHVALVDRDGHAVADVCTPCAAVAIRDMIAVVALPQESSRSTVRLLDWNGRQQAAIQTVTTARIGVLELAPAHVAIAANDGGIEVFDRATGQFRWRTSIGEVPQAMNIDKAGRIWVLGTFSGVFAFDLATGMPLAHFPTEGADAMLVSDDGRDLETWTLGGPVSWWSIPPPSRAAIAPTRARVMQIVEAPDGTLVTGSIDGTVTRYGHDGLELDRFATSSLAVSSLQVLPDGAILSASHRNEAIVWEPKTHRVLGRFRGARAAANADGTAIATGTDDGEVALCERSSAACRNVGKLDEAVIRIGWAAAASVFAAIDDNGQVVAWDARSGRALRELATIGFSAGMDLALSPDGRWLVRCALAAVPPRLHALVPGTADRLLGDAPIAEVYGAAFTSDGARVALAGNGFVGVWDIETGRPRMIAHTGTLSAAVAFAPSGELLYSVGIDRALRVWDIGTEALLLRVAVPDEAYKVVVAQDGARATIATLGAALQLDTSPFTGDRDALVRITRERSRWRIDDSGRLVNDR